MLRGMSRRRARGFIGSMKIFIELGEAVRLKPPFGGTLVHQTTKPAVLTEGDTHSHDRIVLCTRELLRKKRYKVVDEPVSCLLCIAETKLRI